jgi:hypothetical protein
MYVCRMYLLFPSFSHCWLERERRSGPLLKVYLYNTAYIHCLNVNYELCRVSNDKKHNIKFARLTGVHGWCMVDFCGMFQFSFQSSLIFARTSTYGLLPFFVF